MNFKEKPLEKIKCTNLTLYSERSGPGSSIMSNLLSKKIKNGDAQIIIITCKMMMSNYQRDDIFPCTGKKDVLEIGKARALITHPMALSKLSELFKYRLKNRKIILFIDSTQLYRKNHHFLNTLKITDVFVNHDSRNYGSMFSYEKLNINIEYHNRLNVAYHNRDNIENSPSFINITNGYIFDLLNHKRPIWSKRIIRAISNSGFMMGFNLITGLNEIRDILITEPHHLKDFKYFNSFTIEQLYDHLRKTVSSSKERSVFNRMIGNKYGFLATEESFKTFVDLLRYCKDKNHLTTQITNKIARFKSPSEFQEFMVDHVNLLNGWNIDIIENKLQENNISYQKSGRCISAHIENYADMRKVGSPSWCIYTSDNFFNQYTKGDFQQYILFDFNINSDSMSSMIGYTLQKENIAYAHLKNDRACQPVYLKDLIKDFHILS